MENPIRKRSLLAWLSIVWAACASFGCDDAGPVAEALVHEARDDDSASAQAGAASQVPPSAATASTTPGPAAPALGADDTPIADHAALQVPPEPLRDPGTGAWDEVPRDQVQALCGLDPAALDRSDRSLNAPWAIVRHGRLCHSFRAQDMAPEEAFSTTKTLTGVVAGALAYRTHALPVHGPKTGPFSDLDPVRNWVDKVSYNPEARVAHVFGMVANNTNLSLGKRTMLYDGTGFDQVNSLSGVLNAAIRQDTTLLGAGLDEFTHRYLFRPLGMAQSTWGDGSADKNIAFTWTTTVLDMARLGLLILNKGMWSGERVLDETWLYRMTHPSFEDANTAFGYLMWLNSASNYHFTGVIGLLDGYEGVQQVPRLPGPCAPMALAATHPHGLSDSPDCHYRAPYVCEQLADAGVWQAVGLFGQVIQGHPGLDLVIVAKNLTVPSDLSGMSAPEQLWDSVRPALVLADPTFNGDDDAFCQAYGRSRYTPDLR